LDLEAGIIVNEVLPYIEKNYRTVQESTSRAVMGGGYDGFIGLYTTLKFPRVFGNVAIQSIEMLDEDMKLLVKEFKTSSEQPLLFYLDWGLYDMRGTREGWDMNRTNQQVDALMREKGYRPAGGEFHDSYGWGSWRNRTDRWLTALFPM
jgi:enterochelin esterase family protein